MAAAFGSGKLFPTYVVVTFDSPLVQGRYFNSTEMGAVSSISDYVASNHDVRNVSGPTRPFGEPVPYESLNDSDASGALTFSAIMQQVGRDNKTALVTVDFAVDPFATAAISDTQVVRHYLNAKLRLCCRCD